MYHVLEVILFVRPNFPLSHTQYRDLLPEDNFSQSVPHSPPRLAELNGALKVI